MINDLYRTMFFVPGNAPGKIAKAEIYGEDCIVFDLEDAVSIYEKDAARDLLCEYLSSYRPNCRFGIRINGQDTEYYEDDVRALVPLKPDFLRLPKSETKKNITDLDALLTECEKKAGIEVGSIKIAATIETALGVYNAYEIATASPRMFAIGLGGEDFRADMRMTRTETAEELLFARNQISLCAHAAKVIPMDYVNSNFRDAEAFKADVAFGKKIGYTCKSCIHPNQIPLVHEVYTPTDKEIEQARKVVAVYDEAIANGSGAIALDGKMIDMPIVTRAKATLAYAKAAGKEI
jgi:citrate lyase subunit beta/citryl-CoA lyase